MRRQWAAVLGAVLVVRTAAQEHEHRSPPTSGEKLGTVRFETTCAATTRAQFTRAVALLHSFEFAPSMEAFASVAKTDPGCGIAYWGLALGSWGNPFAAGVKPKAQLARGREAAERGASLAAGSDRERGYIQAVAELYKDSERRSQQERVLGYRDAMAALAARFPEDSEARIFYALALAQAVPPTDKSYADLLKAGAILEPLFAQQQDHPGLAHYIIHSYDVPPLAERALSAARRYAKIAPSAPHALHMPSHTFTRLGYWKESIETNIASAATAKRDGATAEELHATDYQVYAYLQTGQDAAAKRLLDSLPQIAARFDPDAVASAAPGVAGVFALAAIPARWALERGDWAEAARLEPRASRFSQTEAITYFARGLGAARSGEPVTARAAADALQQLRDRLASASENYWAGQVEIQRRLVLGWLAFAESRRTEAIAEMRAAVELEEATDKNAITPGPLVPARELLGELLLEAREPAQAREQFAVTLQTEPGRFRALAGAARAAAALGDRADARKYSADLLKTCERGDNPGRPELVAARRTVAKP